MDKLEEFFEGNKKLAIFIGIVAVVLILALLKG